MLKGIVGYLRIGFCLLVIMKIFVVLVVCKIYIGGN